MRLSSRRAWPGSHKRPPRGFALMTALWVLVAIAAIAMNAAVAARQDRLVALNVVEMLAARRAAESALADLRSQFDLYHVSPPPAAMRLSSQGTAGTRLARETPRDSIQFGDAFGRVVYQDAGGRLNINLATSTDLQRLLAGLYIDAGVADQVAQAMVDWRDTDDARYPRGAERADYLSAGAEVLPPNQPFARVEELEHVRGVSPSLLARVKPYFTTEGSGRINIAIADRVVLLTLPGMSEEAVAEIVRSRTSPRGLVTLDELPGRLSSSARMRLIPALPALRGRTVIRATEVEVLAEGWLPGSKVRATVRALLVRTGDSHFVIGHRAE